MWHADTADQRSTLAEYRDATAGSRLHALADYLSLDWSRLRTRCAELGDVVGLLKRAGEYARTCGAECKARSVP